jgi:hypothetical protein
MKSDGTVVEQFKKGENIGWKEDVRRIENRIEIVFK